MKLKFIFVTVLLCVLGYFTFSQAQVANAGIDTCSQNNVGPLTYYAQGKIEYWYNGAKFGAPNVDIHAVSTGKNKRVHCMRTDAQGMYSLPLDADKYVIKVMDYEKSHFNPLSQKVDVRKKNVYEINFYAQLHHSPIIPK